MGVTSPLTTTSSFAVYSLSAVQLSLKELSNQPLSHASAPCPVQQSADSDGYQLAPSSSPGFAARTVDVDRRAPTA
jgi:hypothetical protein